MTLLDDPAVDWMLANLRERELRGCVTGSVISHCAGRSLVGRNVDP